MGCFLIKQSVGCTIDTFVPFHKSGKGRKHSMYFTTFNSVKLNLLRTVHILRSKKHTFTLLGTCRKYIDKLAGFRQSKSLRHSIETFS